MMTLIKEYTANESGAAFIELALILPLFFFLAFTSLEAALVLREWQLATSLSRELSSVAFRECAVHRGSLTQSRFDPQTCFNNDVQSKFSNKLAKLAPNASFVVQMYTTKGGLQRGAVLQHTAPGISPRQTAFPVSRVSAAATNPNSSLGRSAQQYETLVIGEVFIPYSGIAALVPRIVNFRVKEVYAVTIL